MTAKLPADALDALLARGCPFPAREAGWSTAHLAFARDPAGRSYVGRQHVPYPLHVCKALYRPQDPPGMPLLQIQSCSGGLFQHDRLRMAIVMEETAQAHVTTSASTIVHTMERGDAAQEVWIDAGPGAYLEYLPSPLILFPRARLRSLVRVRVCERATVVACDAFIVHDPKGAGGVFDRLHAESVVEAPGGRVLARDRFVLQGDVLCAALPGVTGPYTAQSTVMVVDRTRPGGDLVGALRGALDPLEGIYAGASLLPNECGAWARLLAVDGAALRKAITAAGLALRQCITARASGRG